MKSLEPLQKLWKLDIYFLQGPKAVNNRINNFRSLYYRTEAPNFKSQFFPSKHSFLAIEMIL